MGIKTRILTTLNIYNYKDVWKMWALLSNLWVSEWHIGRTTNAWRARFIYNWLIDGVIFNESDLERLKNDFPTIKIQYNYPSKASKYYGLIIPNWQMATQDYLSWEKIALGSLVEKSFSDFWTEDNFDIRGHYYKWLNLNPDTF
jgi:MoaA/NifB/PqqE/SkfB family radical SAM enzyme